MRKTLPILGFASALVLVVILMGYRSDLSRTASGTTDGAAVFRETCAQCHGFNGEGLVNLTPPLRGRNLPVAQIKTTVQRGGQKMPPLPFIKGDALENVARFVSGLK